MKSKHSPIFRAAAIAVAFSFVVEQAVFAAPEPPSVNLSVFARPYIGFELPYSVAFIEDAYQAPSGSKTVILLQDAHTNESGQINVAKSLEHIVPAEKIRTVYLEAGTGNVSLSFLRDKAPLERRKSVALAYLKKGLLQGSEYFNLTSDYDVKLWGVEDKALYDKAVTAYRAIVGKRDEFRDYLAKIEGTIKSLKPKIFNPALKEFDDVHSAYLANEIPMTQYFSKLVEAADERGVAVTDFRHLKSLDELKRKEEKIDFKKAGEEQQAAVESLSEADRDELLRISRSGQSPLKVSFGMEKAEKAFYAVLEDKVGRVAAYPELKKYLEYLKETQDLNAKEVLREQAVLESAIYEKLALSADEKSLHEADKSLRSLGGYMELAVSPDEFSVYEKNPMRFDVVFITGFLNRKIMDLGSNYEKAVFLETGFEDVLKRAEEFYRLTYLRDAAFVDTMTKRMDTENEAKSVLITGGYHTPSLKEILKQRGISYVSVTPQIFHPTDTRRYERILLGQMPEIRGEKETVIALNKLMVKQVIDLARDGSTALLKSFVARVSDPDKADAALRQANVIIRGGDVPAGARIAESSPASVFDVFARTSVRARRGTGLTRSEIAQRLGFGGPQERLQPALGTLADLGLIRRVGEDDTKSRYELPAEARKNANGISELLGENLFRASLADAETVEAVRDRLDSLIPVIRLRQITHALTRQTASLRDFDAIYAKALRFRQETLERNPNLFSGRDIERFVPALYEAEGRRNNMITVQGTILDHSGAFTRSRSANLHPATLAPVTDKKARSLRRSPAQMQQIWDALDASPGSFVSVPLRGSVMFGFQDAGPYIDAFTPENPTLLEDMPSLMTVRSENHVVATVETYREGAEIQRNKIQYANETWGYSITSDLPVKLTDKLEAPRGQLDAVAYILGAFGLHGLKITIKVEHPAMLVGGGFESSNAYNLDLGTVAQLLTALIGETVTTAELFAMLRRIAPNELRDRTGLQGALAALQEYPVTRHHFMGGVRKNGKVMNPHAVFSRPVGDAALVEWIGRHSLGLMPGIKLRNNDRVEDRQDKWTGRMMLDLIKNKRDPASYAAAERMKRIVTEAHGALLNQDIDSLVRLELEYGRIRYGFQKRWFELAGEAADPSHPFHDLYQTSQTDPDLQAVDPKEPDLYTGGFKALFDLGEKFGLALTPLGKGGKGANWVIRGRPESIRRFLRSKELAAVMGVDQIRELTDGEAERAIQDKSGNVITLAGWIPLYLSAAPIKVSSDLGKIPPLEKAVFSQASGTILPAAGARVVGALPDLTAAQKASVERAARLSIVLGRGLAGSNRNYVERQIRARRIASPNDPLPEIWSPATPGGTFRLTADMAAPELQSRRAYNLRDLEANTQLAGAAAYVRVIHGKLYGGVGERFITRLLQGMVARMSGKDPASLSPKATKATKATRAGRFERGGDGRWKFVPMAVMTAEQMVSTAKQGQVASVAFLSLASQETEDAIFDVESHVEPGLRAAGADILEPRIQGLYLPLARESAEMTDDLAAKTSAGGTGFWFMDLLDWVRRESYEQSTVLTVSNGEFPNLPPQRAVEFLEANSDLAMIQLEITTTASTRSGTSRTGMIRRPSGLWVPAILEPREIDMHPQADLIRDAGVTRGQGQQTTNGNMFLIHANRIGQILNKLEDILGPETLLDILTADPIFRAGTYDQIDSAFTSGLHNLEVFLRADYRNAPGLSDLQRQRINQELPRGITAFVQVPADEISRVNIPIKQISDAWYLMTSRYGRDASGSLVDLRQAKPRAAIRMDTRNEWFGKSGDLYYYLRGFGLAQTDDLTDFSVIGEKGVILTAGTLDENIDPAQQNIDLRDDVRLIGKVEIVNNTGRVVNLRELAVSNPAIARMIGADDVLMIRNERITLTIDGENISAEITPVGARSAAKRDHSRTVQKALQAGIGGLDPTVEVEVVQVRPSMKYGRFSKALWQTRTAQSLYALLLAHHQAAVNTKDHIGKNNKNALDKAGTIAFEDGLDRSKVPSKMHLTEGYYDVSASPRPGKVYGHDDSLEPIYVVTDVVDGTTPAAKGWDGAMVISALTSYKPAPFPEGRTLSFTVHQRARNIAFPDLAEGPYEEKVMGVFEGVAEAWGIPVQRLLAHVGDDPYFIQIMAMAKKKGIPAVGSNSNSAYEQLSGHAVVNATEAELNQGEAFHLMMGMGVTETVINAAEANLRNGRTVFRIVSQDAGTAQGVASTDTLLQFSQRELGFYAESGFDVNATYDSDTMFGDAADLFTVHTGITETKSMIGGGPAAMKVENGIEITETRLLDPSGAEYLVTIRRPVKVGAPVDFRQAKPRAAIRGVFGARAVVRSRDRARGPRPAKDTGPRVPDAASPHYGTNVRPGTESNYIRELSREEYTPVFRTADDPSRPTHALDRILNQTTDFESRREAAVSAAESALTAHRDHVIAGLSNRLFDGDAREREEALAVARAIGALGELKKSRILVTGGEGFIDYHQVKKLLREGHQVVVLAHEDNGAFNEFKSDPNFQIIVDNQFGDLFNILGNVHSVANLARIQPYDAEGRINLEAYRLVALRDEQIFNFAEAQRMRLERTDPERAKNFHFVNLSDTRMYGDPYNVRFLEALGIADAEGNIVDPEGLEVIRRQGIPIEARGIVHSHNYAGETPRIREMRGVVRNRMQYAQGVGPGKAAKTGPGRRFEDGRNADRGLDVRTLRVGADSVVGEKMPVNPNSVLGRAILNARAKDKQPLELEDRKSEEMPASMNLSHIDGVTDTVYRLITQDVEIPMNDEATPEDKTRAKVFNAPASSMTLAEFESIYSNATGGGTVRIVQPEANDSAVDPIQLKTDDTTLAARLGFDPASTRPAADVLREALTSQDTRTFPAASSSAAPIDPMVQFKKIPAQPVTRILIRKDGSYSVEGVGTVDERPVDIFGHFKRDPNKPKYFGSGLGGAIGNLYNRMRLASGWQGIVLDNFSAAYPKNYQEFFDDYPGNLMVIRADSTYPVEVYYEIDETDAEAKDYDKRNGREFSLDGAAVRAVPLDFDIYFPAAAYASPPKYDNYVEATERTGVNQITQFYGMLENQWKRYLVGVSQTRGGIHYTSTSEFYGDIPDGAMPVPITFGGNRDAQGWRVQYDETKAGAETFMHAFAQHLVDHHEKIAAELGLDPALVLREARQFQYVISRTFNTWGDGMHPGDGRVVTMASSFALQGRALKIYGDGTQTRSMISIISQLQGLILLQNIMLGRVAGKKFGNTPLQHTFNVGNGEEDGEVTMKEFGDAVVEETAHLTGRRAPVHQQWPTLVRTQEDCSAGVCLAVYTNLAAARQKAHDLTENVRDPRIDANTRYEVRKIGDGRWKIVVSKPFYFNEADPSRLEGHDLAAYVGTALPPTDPQFLHPETGEKDTAKYKTYLAGHPGVPTELVALGERDAAVRAWLQNLIVARIKQDDPAELERFLQGRGISRNEVRPANEDPSKFVVVWAEYDDSDPRRRQPNVAETKALGWKGLTVPFQEQIRQMDFWFLSIDRIVDADDVTGLESAFDYTRVPLLYDVVMDRARNQAWSIREIRLLVHKFNQFHFAADKDGVRRGENESGLNENAFEENISQAESIRRLDALLDAFAHNIKLHEYNLADLAYQEIDEQGLLLEIEDLSERARLQGKLQSYRMNARRLMSVTRNNESVRFSVRRGQEPPILSGAVEIENQATRADGTPRQVVLNEPQWRRQLPKYLFENGDQTNGRMVLRNVRITIREDGTVSVARIRNSFTGKKPLKTSVSGVFDRIAGLTDRSGRFTLDRAELGRMSAPLAKLVEWGVIRDEGDGAYILAPPARRAAVREELSELFNETMPTREATADTAIAGFVAPVVWSIVSSDEANRVDPATLLSEEEEFASISAVGGYGPAITLGETAIASGAVPEIQFNGPNSYDTLTTIRTLRAAHPNPRTPIAVSGLSGPQDADIAVGAGANVIIVDQANTATAERAEALGAAVRTVSGARIANVREAVDALRPDSAVGYDDRRRAAEFLHDHYPTIAALPMNDVPLDSVSVLIGVFTADDHFHVKTWIADALGGFGPRAVAALPVLIEAMRDPNERVRHAAAKAIGNIGRETPAVLAALGTALKDPSTYVVSNAATAIGKIGPANPQIVEDLIFTLNHDDLFVRLSSERALADITTKHPALSSQLTFVLTNPPKHSTKDRVVRHVAAALTTVRSGPIGSIQEAVNALRPEGAIEPAQRAAAAQYLSAQSVIISQTTEGLPEDAARVLAQAYVAEENSFIRPWIADALGGFGPRAADALPALVEATKDPNERVRHTAAKAIGSIKQATPDVLAALTAALSDKSSYVVSNAATALGDIAPESASIMEDLIRILTHEDPFVRISAEHALSAIARKHLRNIQRLVDALTHLPRYFVSAAQRKSALQGLLDVLAEIGANVRAQSGGSAVLVPIRSILFDADPDLVMSAVRAAGQVGKNASHREEGIGPIVGTVSAIAVRGILADRTVIDGKTKHDLQNEAIIALGEIGRAAHPASRDLMSLWDESDGVFQPLIAAALGGIGTEEEGVLELLLEKGIASPNEAVRRSTAQSLIRIARINNWTLQQYRQTLEQLIASATESAPNTDAIAAMLDVFAALGPAAVKVSSGARTPPAAIFGAARVPLVASILEKASQEDVTAFGLPQGFDLKNLPSDTRIILRLIPQGTPLTKTGTPKLYNQAVEKIPGLSHEKVVVLSHAVDISNPEAIAAFLNEVKQTPEIAGLIIPANIKSLLRQDPNLARLFEGDVSKLAGIDPIVVRDGKLLAFNNMGTPFVSVVQSDLNTTDLTGKNALVVLAEANGKSVAIALARAGADVTIFHNDNATLADMKTLADKHGLTDRIRILNIETDLAAVEAAAKAADVALEAQEHYGPWTSFDKLAGLIPDSVIQALSGNNRVRVYSLGFGATKDDAGQPIVNQENKPSTLNLNRLRAAGLAQTQLVMGDSYLRQINHDGLITIGEVTGLLDGIDRESIRAAFNAPVAAGARLHQRTFVVRLGLFLGVLAGFFPLEGKIAVAADEPNQVVIASFQGAKPSLSVRYYDGLTAQEDALSDELKVERVKQSEAGAAAPSSASKTTLRDYQMDLRSVEQAVADESDIPSVLEISMKPFAGLSPNSRAFQDTVEILAGKALAQGSDVAFYAPKGEGESLVGPAKAIAERLAQSPKAKGQVRDHRQGYPDKAVIVVLHGAGEALAAPEVNTRYFGMKDVPGDESNEVVPADMIATVAVASRSLSAEDVGGKVVYTVSSRFADAFNTVAKPEKRAGQEQIGWVLSGDARGAQFAFGPIKINFDQKFSLIRMMKKLLDIAA